MNALLGLVALNGGEPANFKGIGPAILR